ncbi:MAG: hypothetical protein CL583_18080 [Alteromonadaceae bacterium]|nr:hypothetical protein [Alteromonadaceae bacterium]|tara:strand:- start:1280 stop:1492 length:213 start_codon:yes stop_codon:yes gene_type:complete
MSAGAEQAKGHHSDLDSRPFRRVGIRRCASVACLLYLNRDCHFGQLAEASECRAPAFEAPKPGVWEADPS